MPVRLYIGMGNQAAYEKIRVTLEENGYTIIGNAETGSELLENIRTLMPDIAIIDSRLSLIDGVSVTGTIIDGNICDVLLLSSPDEEFSITDEKSKCIFSNLVKPVSRSTMLEVLRLLTSVRTKINSLENEADQLRTSLDTRKEVEKAKGLLMKNLGLTEPDAFKKIQKQSMDKGIPMKEIARAIILAYDI